MVPSAPGFARTLAATVSRRSAGPGSNPRNLYWRSTRCRRHEASSKSEPGGAWPKGSKATSTLHGVETADRPTHELWLWRARGVLCGRARRPRHMRACRRACAAARKRALARPRTHAPACPPARARLRALRPARQRARAPAHPRAMSARAPPTRPPFQTSARARARAPAHPCSGARPPTRRVRARRPRHARACRGATDRPAAGLPSRTHQRAPARPGNRARARQPRARPHACVFACPRARACPPAPAPARAPCSRARAARAHPPAQARTRARAHPPASARASASARRPPTRAHTRPRAARERARLPITGFIKTSNSELPELPPHKLPDEAQQHRAEQDGFERARQPRE